MAADSNSSSLLLHLTTTATCFSAHVARWTQCFEMIDGMTASGDGRNWLVAKQKMMTHFIDHAKLGVFELKLAKSVNLVPIADMNIADYDIFFGIYVCYDGGVL